MVKRVYISALLASLVLLLAVPALAQEAAPEAGAEAEMTTIQRRVYDYNPEDRRDPFVSLVAPVTKEITKTGDPLRDNDISEMRVIAIVWDAADRYALFGLPDGKFYTIKEGREIGLFGGHVEEILKDSVVVREMKRDFKGNLQPVDTYIRLRKEEGQ